VRRLVVVLAALAVAGGGTLVATSAAAAAPATPSALPAIGSITWGPCSDPFLQQANAQCGMLSVPLDYDHPSGTHISLAVSRVKHTSPASQYQGVMLVNPGGPGGSGLDLSTLGSSVPGDSAGTYDWIGFDPRGVGASVPSLTCDPNYFDAPRPAYVPTSHALEQTWLTRSKDYAKACGKAQPGLLANMTTVDSAKDMDAIRVALGQRQINYYGFSYGTYLGQVYSTLFPQRVRRMVLDSNVDPRGVWYQDNLDQDVAFDKNIDIWFAWVAKYDNVFHLGTTQGAVQRLFYATQAKLTKHAAGGVVGGDEWNDIFLQAGYYRFGWVDLGNAFSDYVHTGAAQPLITLYQQTDGPGDDNSFAVYLGVQCSDVQWPTNWNQWRVDNWRTYAQAPFETWNNAWFNAPCVYWPTKPSTPVRIDGSKVAGALLIDETLDAATPFPGSLQVRKLFPRSSLIAEPGGTTHADSLFGDLCVDDQVADYLASGKLPARKPGNGPDTTCAPLPDPVPTAASAGAAAHAATATSTSAQAVVAERELLARSIR
jgi:pimeloyl-ACP methyl ester carboxylesterase